MNHPRKNTLTLNPETIQLNQREQKVHPERTAPCLTALIHGFEGLFANSVDTDRLMFGTYL